jgi:ABC-2 type transport system permease protein
MTTMAREMRASYAFIERNFNLTRRYWGWEAAFLVYAIAGALSVTLIGQEQNDPTLILTLMIGAIFWNYLSVVFSFIAETIQWERWEGTLEYTMMAPVRRTSQLLGATAYAILYGLVSTLIVMTVLVAFFGLDLSSANFATAASSWPSARSRSRHRHDGRLSIALRRRGAQMTFVLQSLLLLVSGVYYSVEILPPWMQFLSKFSPATYILDGVRAGLIEGTPVSDLAYDVWPLIVMAVVFIPLGIKVFGWAEKYAKRTGKLKRVG